MLFTVFFKLISFPVLRFICMDVVIERHRLRLIFIKSILVFAKKVTNYCICHEALKQQWQTISVILDFYYYYVLKKKTVSEVQHLFNVSMSFIGIIKVINNCECKKLYEQQEPDFCSYFVKICWEKKFLFIDSILCCSYLFSE